MMRARHGFSLGCLLAACASPGVPGHAGAAAPVETVRPNIYEVVLEEETQAQETPFIEVSGNGSVDVPADRAEISFAMETRSQEAAAASSANAAQMARVLAALRGAGFEGLEIETFGYSLQPQYATDPSRVRTIVGYVAFNNVRAVVRDVNDVGRLIDVAVAAGANRVASLSFSASDMEAARTRALGDAVRSARAQAEAIASSLGYELGAPLEIRGGAQRPVPIMFDAARTLQAQAAPTPIEPGSQTVDANVTIRFALGRELARP